VPHVGAFFIFVQIVIMKLAPDKWRHIFAGFFIGLVLPIIGHYMFDFPVVSNYFLSVFGLMLISYGFEVFSFVSGKGHYDMVDAIVTVLGGLPGLAFSVFFI
jgi:hypothetical protein